MRKNQGYGLKRKDGWIEEVLELPERNRSCPSKNLFSDQAGEARGLLNMDIFELPEIK
jgi:hypothetical protein